MSTSNRPITEREAFDRMRGIVSGLVRRYSHWRIPADDLLSEANIGVWKAWGLWDGRRPWETFATEWALGHILHAVRRELQWFGRTNGGSAGYSPVRLCFDGVAVERVSTDPFGRAMRVLDADDAVPQPPTITEHQVRVLAMLADGLPDKEIATRVGISITTVRYHTNGLYKSLGASGRMDAIREGIRRGLIPCPYCNCGGT